MLGLQKPIIFSFEYQQERNEILNKVLSYIKNNNILNVTITNFIPISILKKINASFVSLDINFYELDFNKINFIREYNKFLGQIRIIVEGYEKTSKLNNALKKIRENFSGSIVLLYKFSKKSFDFKKFRRYLCYSEKLKLSLSLLPDIIEAQSDYKFFIDIFSKFKEKIKNGTIFIDSPFIYRKISGQNNYCPGANLMCHIDCAGNFKICKFDSFCFGNVLNTDIQNLWQRKNQIIKNKFKNQLINKCLLMGSKQKPYAVLSKIYDQVMAVKEKMYNDYLRFIRSEFPNKNIKILDVACGTGTLIKKISKYYKNIEGVEVSKEMAQVAKKKTGKKIYRQDMSELKINKKYDLILCTFDSLNYLLSETALSRTIKNFYQHLAPKGVLIFDVNSIDKFKNHFNKIFEYKIGKIKTRWISSYKRPFWRLEIEFEQGGKIYQEVHNEKFYSISNVKKILKKNKFKKIKIFKGHLLNERLNEKRVFFLAKK